MDEVITFHAGLITQFGARSASEIAARSNPLWQDRRAAIIPHDSGSCGSVGEPFPESSVCGWKQGRRCDRDGSISTVNRYRLRFDDSEAFAFLVRLYESGRPSSSRSNGPMRKKT